MDKAKRAECAAFVAAQIEAAEAGRSELVADLSRRREALRADDIQCSEPRYSASEARPPSPETPEFLTDVERAAVRQFVADGNSADMGEAPKVHYSEPRVSRRRDTFSEPREFAPTAYANSQGWEDWLTTRIEAEQRLVLEAVGEAVGDMLDEEAKAHEAERNKLRDKLRDLEIALVNARTDIVNLRSLLVANGKDYGVIDMPKWPKTGNGTSVN
jgi:hypothetical protein